MSKLQVDRILLYSDDLTEGRVYETIMVPIRIMSRLSGQVFKSDVSITQLLLTQL